MQISFVDGHWQCFGISAFNCFVRVFLFHKRVTWSVYKVQATLWRLACMVCYKLNAKLQIFVLLATRSAPNVRKETIAYMHWLSIKVDKRCNSRQGHRYWKKYHSSAAENNLNLPGSIYTQRSPFVRLSVWHQELWTIANRCVEVYFFISIFCSQRREGYAVP